MEIQILWIMGKWFFKFKNANLKTELENYHVTMTKRSLNLSVLYKLINTSSNKEWVSSTLMIWNQSLSNLIRCHPICLKLIIPFRHKLCWIRILLSYMIVGFGQIQSHTQEISTNLIENLIQNIILACTQMEKTLITIDLRLIFNQQSRSIQGSSTIWWI